jgi:hypothetical protein
MGSVSVSWRSDVWGSKWPKGPPERTYRRVGVSAFVRWACRGCEPGGRHTGPLLTQVNPGLSFLDPSGLRGDG